MRSLLLLVIFGLIANSVFAQVELELFPKNIKIDNYKHCLCKFDTVNIKAEIIKEDFGENGKLSYDYSRFKFVDLNSDNKCEVIHYFSSGVRGWPHDFITIYSINEKSSIHKIFDQGSFLVSFAESDGNFVQITNTYFKGHKTNPIYYIETWKIIGDKYRKYYSPELTKGEFKEKGLKAYRSKKYEEAFICFSNVLHFPHNTSNAYLNSLNDLAITLIKLRRYEEVESLYKNTIEKSSDMKSLASANFNIGLAKEKEGKKAAAISYFKKSLKQHWTKAAEEKVKFTSANNVQK
ncbi:hypothetical protein SAMN06265379_1243 [Saccharicrinis carchari]|uniref:Uncharacterized protein n=1 Tax=Saccharicrinis carchari TaxID=1168039 RepID=A0A521FF02_SACCC|nr:tetratricopeptide repeat protein [Saccharicrinis carchari]SMO94665.1 hypothetical protein SAMN06265379_1243 [Saccharicrinis carchari]